MLQLAEPMLILSGIANCAKTIFDKAHDKAAFLALATFSGCAFVSVLNV